MSINIAFHTNQLGLRGTEVALYDYARYNEEILGNKSIIISKDPAIWDYSHPKAIQKFKDRFSVYFYSDISEIETILDNNNIDIFYAQKSGREDGVVSNKRKSVIHAVFQEYEPHGDRYAYISEWLGKKYNKPFVPYIVDLPNRKDDMRVGLNIPNDAYVFGRHGGIETFDIEWVKSVIIEILNEREDIYFLFMNTDKFYNHPNIIYLDAESDMNKKVEFINTCDAMIHARNRGESFGLAIAEFSMRNKPIITWNGGVDKAHLDILENNCYLYNNKNELLNIFRNFQKIEKDWNMYSQFNPQEVMRIFKSVFIN
jgi:hypothetical protein